jgi:hypothetical protein
MGLSNKLEYKSETGTIRKVLCFSECKRFVYVECKYINGKIINKWFWSCHRLFKTKNKWI